jgi:hypothetical protein
VEFPQSLLKGALASRRRQCVVQAQSFVELLEQTIRRCQAAKIAPSKPPG